MRSRHFLLTPWGQMMFSPGSLLVHAMCTVRLWIHDFPHPFDQIGKPVVTGAGVGVHRKCRRVMPRQRLSFLGVRS